METYHLSEAEIIQLPESTYIGHHKQMSLVADQTQQLWQSFMLAKKEISAPPFPLYSIQEFPNGYFKKFNPQTTFKKWAAIEWNAAKEIPPSMEKLPVAAGLYAKFIYTGTLSEAHKAMQFIFSEWIPSSKYEVDERPHLSMMDERYNPQSSDSIETFFIPVKIVN